MQYLCNISRNNWAMKLFCMLINMKVFCELTLLILMGLARACKKLSDKFTISLWHLKKEVRNEVRFLTALAGSNITLTMYYASNIVPPIQGSRLQNHWVAPRSTQRLILLRSIKWVPGISGNLVVESKLPPRSCSSLEAVEPHP